MCYAPSSGLWIGQREVPTARGEKRRVQRVTSKTFCRMLEKFSALEKFSDPPARPRSRRENLTAAILRGTHTDAEWSAKCKEQRGLCYYCGKEPHDATPRLIMGKLRYLTMPLEKDHKIPVSRDGSDGIDNIVGACAPCNRAKSKMTADEYQEYLHGQTSI